MATKSIEKTQSPGVSFKKKVYEKTCYSTTWSLTWALFISIRSGGWCGSGLSNAKSWVWWVLDLSDWGSHRLLQHIQLNYFCLILDERSRVDHSCCRKQLSYHSDPEYALKNK